MTVFAGLRERKKFMMFLKLILKHKGFPAGSCILSLFFLFLFTCPVRAREPSGADALYRFDRQVQMSFSGARSGKPTSLAIDSTGRLFVVCSLTNDVRVFDSAGRFLFAFGRESSSQDKSGNKGVLKEPSGIAIDKQDLIYISDLAADRILIYSSDGRFLDQFPLHQPEKGRETCAPFIAYNPYDNRLYAADACNHLVGVYTLKGEFKASFGTAGTGEGDLSGPAHISFDTRGNIYVVDAGNFRVQSYTPDFKFRFAFGRSGTKEGEFVRPYGLAIDAKDRIYVSDFIANSVQVFNNKGQYLVSVSQPDNPRLFSQPLGLAWVNNKIYVVNAETKVVSVFDIAK
ncbi:MAG: hypothetical protein AB1611_07895 [bacterium]